MRRLDAGGELDLAAELWPGTAEHLRTVMVASLDGAATVDGRVGELTGPADQRLLHTVRAVSDVVLVGAGTIRAEGYGPLTVDASTAALRTSRGQTPHPGLAIVTARGDLDLDHALFTEAVTRPLVVTVADCPRREALAEVAEVVVAGEHELDVRRAVAGLRERGLGRIGCEGGARLNEALLAADLVDEVVLTLAPLVVGGAGRRIVQGDGLTPPRAARLVWSATEDGHLFTRWSLRG